MNSHNMVQSKQVEEYISRQWEEFHRRRKPFTLAHKIFLLIFGFLLIGAAAILFFNVPITR